MYRSISPALETKGVQNCEQARRVCTFLTPKAVQDVCSASILPCKCRVLLGFAHPSVQTSTARCAKVVQARVWGPSKICTTRLHDIGRTVQMSWSRRAKLARALHGLCTGPAHVFARGFAHSLLVFLLAAGQSLHFLHSFRRRPRVQRFFRVEVWSLERPGCVRAVYRLPR